MTTQRASDIEPSLFGTEADQELPKRRRLQQGPRPTPQPSAPLVQFEKLGGSASGMRDGSFLEPNSRTRKALIGLGAQERHDVLSQLGFEDDFIGSIEGELGIAPTRLPRPTKPSAFKGLFTDTLPEAGRFLGRRAFEHAESQAQTIVGTSFETSSERQFRRVNELPFEPPSLGQIAGITARGLFEDTPLGPLTEQLQFTEQAILGELTLVFTGQLPRSPEEAVERWLEVHPGARIPIELVFDAMVPFMAGKGVRWAGQLQRGGAESLRRTGRSIAARIEARAQRAIDDAINAAPESARDELERVLPLITGAADEPLDAAAKAARPKPVKTPSQLNTEARVRGRDVVAAPAREETIDSLMQTRDGKRFLSRSPKALNPLRHKSLSEMTEKELNDVALEAQAGLQPSSPNLDSDASRLIHEVNIEAIRRGLPTPGSAPSGFS
ncbi:MAG: hypothetical protein IIC82_06160, partial [Chloroflexi bacterium]|nr:hypothetical protein [Chloroflexota bacterium]